MSHSMGCVRRSGLGDPEISQYSNLNTRTYSTKESTRVSTNFLAAVSSLRSTVRRVLATMRRLPAAVGSLPSEQFPVAPLLGNDVPTGVIGCRAPLGVLPGELEPSLLDARE